MRGLLVLVATIALVGCTDTDGDGTRDARDCDPADKTVHPDAPEICNGRDDNCNGQVDEDVAIVAYWDRDLDGFGDAAFARRVCSLPEDGSETPGDCDDLDPLVSPDAPELCDGLDNDCDGEVDEDVTPLTFYADADGDGFGDPGSTIQDCVAPEGYVGNTDDCDDSDPAKWSGALEVCDGIDNNCDGTVDEGLAQVRVYVDGDGDGSGDPAQPTLACGPLPGFSLDDRDCDDTDPNLGGGSDEVQGNGVDEDCDGYVDEYGVPVPFATWEDAVLAIGLGTGTEVIQFDDGWHVVNVDAAGGNYVFAGEGCGRTTLYAATADPVMQLDNGAVEGLTLAGGTAASGGGLRVEGGVVRATGICVEGNAANKNGGGIAAMAGSTLILEDSVVAENQANEIGGGVYIEYDAIAEIRRTMVLDNEIGTLWGGGIGVRGGHAEIHNVVVAGNHANQVGGGIYVANGEGAAGEQVDGSANISWTTIHGNTLDPTAGTQGQGLLVGGSTVDIRNSVFSGHQGPVDVITVKSSTVVEFRTPTFSSFDLGFRDNQAFDQNASWILNSTRPTVLGYADVRPGIDPILWDLRPTAQSGWIDASIDVIDDLDGTPGDLGAWGGPDAAWVEGVPPLWRPWPQPGSLDTEDGDGDGLVDSWETRWGTDPLVPDETADPDADGSDNLTEQAGWIDPLLADTDGDGVDDGTELGAGTDPTSPADNRPLAEAGPDQVVLLGAPVTLDDTGSADPNGDPLTATWAILDAPNGSTAAFTPGSGTFTPDQPGPYVVELTVSDGAGTHSVTRMVEARSGVIVPDDAATLQEALGLVYDGQVIFVRAGTWGSIDLTGRAIGVVGLDGPEQVILDAAGSGPVVRGDTGDLVLAGLTLTGGNDAFGGGISVDGADSLLLRDLVVRDNEAGAGGGAWIHDTVLDGAWLDLRDNLAGEGGGLWVSGQPSELRQVRVHANHAWQGGGLWLDDADHTLDALELQSNLADLGAAIWVGDTGRVHLQNSAVAGNRGGTTVYSDTGNLFSLGVVWLQSEPDAGSVFTLDGAFPANWRPLNNYNGGDDSFWANALIPAALAEPLQPGNAQLVSWIDDGDPDNDLLVPRAGSPLVDAGWPEFVDLDGSPADIGLSGGPSASVFDTRGTWDLDGDGLADAWEELFGLDPNDPSDVALDGDGDGWNALDEYVAGTDPTKADSDGDGLDDPTELANNTDPTSMEDLRPVARVTTPPATMEGEVHTIDGSASSDPFPGPAPLAWEWRVIATPPGSTLTVNDLSDPTAAVATFVPDVGGVYVFGLVVTDGNLVSHEAVLEVRPGRRLEIPSEYPTVADAYAIAELGDVVVLEAGIHDLELSEWVDGVPLVGEGVDQTYVHGLEGRSIFEVDSGDPLVVLRDMTLAGANGNYGGAVDCANAAIELERVRFEWNVSHDGGAMRSFYCDTVLVDVDFYDNDASSRGGALMVTEGSLDWTRGVVGRNSSDGVGGGVYIDNSAATIRNVVLHHNFSESGGGAINQAIRYDPGDPNDPDDDEIPQELLLEHVTVAGNNGRDGALYLNWATVRNAIIQENNHFGIFMSNTDPEASVDGAFSLIHGNLDGDASGQNITLSNIVNGDAAFLAFDPLDDGWVVDFHLPLASPARDIGTTVLGLDPDGSLPDAGAYGGPDAPGDWDVAQIDSDGDGMADLWEQAYGLDPGANDAGNDADLDGLSNLFEHDNGFDPTSQDSDGDGVLDAAENLAGTDPTDPGDNAPVAGIGPSDLFTNVAVGVQRGFTADPSSDPNGDPITGWTWTLVSTPGRSQLGPGDLSHPAPDIVNLTPDSPGTYVVSLQVTANGATSAPAYGTLVVNGTVLVPEDYPSVPEAIAAVSDGHTVDVGAGIWPTVADVSGKDVTLVGAGQDQTILDGEGMGTVLYGNNGEALTVSDLTIANGSAAEGGGIHMELSGGAITLTDVTIRDSQSIYGGAVYVRNGLLDATRTRMVDNHSGRNGGAIYATSSTVDLFQTLVASNTSVALHGGGLNHYNGDLTVVNSIFDDNWTEAQGGAIYLNGTDDGTTANYTAYISQSAFTRNYGEDAGGAIKLFKMNVEVHNTLVVDNQSDVGAAVEVQGAINDLQVDHALASGNLPAHYDVSDNPVLVAPMDGDAFGNLVDRAAELTGLSDDDDWSNDDWTLGVGSEAIDAGDPAVSDPDGTVSDIGPFGGPDGTWTP